MPEPGDIVDFEPPDGPTPESVYLEEITRSIDAQTSAFDLMDGRSNQAFSIGTLTLSISLSVLALAPENIQIPTQSFVLLAGVAIGYVTLIVCHSMANAISGLSTGPNPEELQAIASGEFPGVMLQRWIADVYVESYKINKTAIHRKGRLVALTYVAVLIEGVSLATAVVVILLMRFVA